MSAPDYSQVYRFQTVQDTSVSITVSARGAAANAFLEPAFREQLMDRLQREIGAQVPGAFPPERRDDGAESGFMLDSREAEHSIRQPPTEHHAPPPYKDELRPPHGHPEHGPPDEEMTSPPSEAFYQGAGPPDPATHSPGAMITNLESQILGLTAKNDELNKIVKETADEKEELLVKLKQTEQERDEHVRKRQVDISKIKRLTEMIVKNSQRSDEPLDAEMMQETFKIRNMATEVIKNHFPGEAKFRTDSAKRLNEEYYRRFYDPRLRRNSPEGRRRLLISLLFMELQRWFFGAPAKRFGMPNEMEKQLQRFEKDIESSNKVDTEEALEWRTRTVSYARRLNFDCLDIINYVTHYIAERLAPMTLPGVDKHGNPDKKQVALLENDIFELCSASLELALRFRSSKTKYEFKTFPDDTRQTTFDVDPDLVKPLDTEGPISKPVDQNRRFIFCTLWGALVKTRPSVSGETGERAILEKAQVILYEPDLWGKARDVHGTA